MRYDKPALTFDQQLTTGEHDAVYEAVIDLVSKRLQRAPSPAPYF